jgi:hypothetical protein
MTAAIHIYGVRHHGPGSARQLLHALDELRPDTVLIEGPADASALLPLLADPDMVPPVALLVYATDEPERASFWPFATFSPEYQAACWAVRHGAALRFIDLPASWRFAEPPPEPSEAPQVERSALERDPIGVLAEAAGYDDGESFWRDVIEENPSPGPVFAAVADAMAALRDAAPPAAGWEAAREAHMRLEIAKAAKASAGPIAVVCGAWHVPALQTNVPAAADRALLKAPAKVKTTATWAPWTMPRLALGFGYGAGVTAPGWCAHLWACPPAQAATAWLARIAAALREQGHLVSTASLIEARRLATALAALRGRPAPGFEELREAAIACLCFGEPLLWSGIAPHLLLGDAVGAIPAGVPAAPLLEDLQREQKRLRLKPEALDRELAIDLRSDSGLERSTLLHRLAILGVNWGRLAETGRSRGTFRERWVLRWEPEFAVRLVENLVHGATIARAAAGRLSAQLANAADLQTLAARVAAALTAQLPDAAARGIALISQRAAQTSDALELLASLPPLAQVLRYGEARSTDAARLGELFSRILAQAAIALPYAARALDEAAAAAMRAAVLAANGAVALAQVAGDELVAWRIALRRLLDDQQAAPLLAGAAARLLYEAETITPAEAADLLARMFSPGRPLAAAAGFFEGFFEGSGERLIYDNALRDGVDAWLQRLDPDEFTAHLPLFRRSFANLDRMQRKRLLDALFGRATGALPGLVLASDAAAIWPVHFARVAGILTAPQAAETEP